jgi:hypothetical protein
VVDDDVLPCLQHEVEVAAMHGVFRPPAVDDAPFLAHDCDVLPVDATRRAVRMVFDERGSWVVETTRA